MKKILLLSGLFVFFSLRVFSQLEIAKIVGKNAGNYSIGFGAVLKFSYPITDASDATLEIGALFFFEKDDNSNGIATIPLKLGYRYLINGTGEGFYVEPQVGYNLYGVNSYTDNYGYSANAKFNGVVLGAGIGYLFPQSRIIQFDLGLRYETIIFNGNNLSYIGLRLTHNFSFAKRQSDY